MGSDRGELLTSREPPGPRARVMWKVPTDIACPQFAFSTEGKSFIQAASGRKKVLPTHLATQLGAQEDALTLF